jgi:hypothetical protein
VNALRAQAPAQPFSAQLDSAQLDSPQRDPAQQRTASRFIESIPPASTPSHLLPPPDASTSRAA